MASRRDGHHALLAAGDGHSPALRTNHVHTVTFSNACDFDRLIPWIASFLSFISCWCAAWPRFLRYGKATLGSFIRYSVLTGV
jgi:hypothetical protein